MEIDIAGGLPSGIASGAGMPLAAGMSSAAGAYLQYRWNRAEAQRQRDWNERMSNTQWQRGVADMRAAGINPLVAFGGAPAGFPGGAAASAPTSPGVGVSSALEARMNRQQVHNLELEGGVLESERKKRFHESNKAMWDELVARHMEGIYSAEHARARREGAMWDTKYGELLPYMQTGSEVARNVMDAVVKGVIGGASARAVYRMKDIMREVPKLRLRSYGR